MCNTKQKKKGQILKSYIYVQLLSINWIKKKIKGLHWVKWCVINNIPPDKKKSPYRVWKQTSLESPPLLGKLGSKLCLLSGSAATKQMVEMHKGLADPQRC